MTKPNAKGTGPGVSLRARLLITNAALLFAVFIFGGGYFIYSHDAEMKRALERDNAALRQGLSLRAMALARNIAHSSERALAVQNYFFLAEVVQTTVENDDEIIFGTIMDKERRALVHSDPKLAQSTLDDEGALFAVAQQSVTTRRYEREGRTWLEAVAPIFVASELWGSIRLGLTLENLQRQFAGAEAEIKTKTRNRILGTLGGCLLLLVVVAFASAVAAGRITYPLAQLMRGVERIRDGEMGHRVRVDKIPEFVGLAASFNEMTRVVQVREQELEDALVAAEEANRLKSEFLANVSHELRTPLNGIMNIPNALIQDYSSIAVLACQQCEAIFELEGSNDAELTAGKTVPHEFCPKCRGGVTIEKRTFCTGEPDEHLRLNVQAASAAKHLLGVVNDLLDFSKLEAGQVPVAIEATEIDGVFDEVKATLETIRADRQVDLSFACEQSGIELRADRVKLSQILVNLVDNALKFTESGGRVSVVARRAHLKKVPHVQILVSDTGVGIPQEQLPNVFDRFRQVDGSHTRRFGGTGLGLSISKALVDLHDGDIVAESELGKGSTFSVWLPEAGPQDESSEALPDAEGARGQEYRVMVVDDDEAQLAVADTVLRRAGFVTHLSSNPKDALQALWSEPPDAIILDVMMPGVSGLTMLRLLKEDPRTAPVPVIVSTAFHSNRDVAKKLGGIWAPKPYSGKRLVQRILSAIDAREALEDTGDGELSSRGKSA